VRAVAFTQTARPAAEGSDIGGHSTGIMRSSAIWTSVADTRNLVYYYHTQHNRRVRMVDLKKLDFDPRPGGFSHYTLDKVKSQDVDDVTP